MVIIESTLETTSKKVSISKFIACFPHTPNLTGTYVCAKCGHELFESSWKFDHPSAWPAFSKTIESDSVKKEQETATAFRVSCGQCGQRLGHEFLRDGPSPNLSRF